jgi:SAM-dependent methyltransferase
MKLIDIEQHWENWAKEFKLDVRATTKTRTIKELEVAALYQAFARTPFFTQTACRVLEVGCGNGHNCFMLHDLLPHFEFTGVDFIPEMIDNAEKIKYSGSKYDAIHFAVGNVLELDENTSLDEQYQIVFTDRCLINLNTHALQQQALDQLYKKTVPGGYVVLIENVEQTYKKQNALRESVGLQARTPDAYNLFLNEESFLAHASKNLQLIDAVDFASLHDLILYVLVPMMNNGKVDYDAKIVHSATQLLLASEKLGRACGSFGQNRLYLFRKDGGE